MDNNTFAQCVAEPTVQQTILNGLLDNATAVGELFTSASVLSALLSNPAVQKALSNNAAIQLAIFNSPAAQAQIAATVSYTVDSTALRYGGPSIIIGLTVAVALFSVGVATWRLFSKRNVRGYLLLVTSILTVMDSLTGVWGKVNPPSAVFGERHVVGYVMALLVVPEVRDFTLNVAAAYRYAAVYTDERQSRAVLVAQSTIAFAVTAAGVGIAIPDLLRQGYVRKSFWGLAAVHPIIYVATGLATFTYKLRVAQSSVNSATNNRDSKLANLEIANNLIMAFTFAAAISGIVVVTYYDVAASIYVIPTEMFLCALWTLGENFFEALASARQTLVDANFIDTPSSVQVSRIAAVKQVQTVGTAGPRSRAMLLDEA
ncbi:uncharacterized protein EV422DRAFT_572137 [Fimicolochytrium jonesii]|uniref:uncharacterized protein n=1 Tax=Fimicolochytrium jonesii TaxID=1396493 RepID=UPI0022FE22DF|nr:uncharacterized protein EV422DRAFT_572137 [Fimicolochytrium jonesii]KAI8816076.1 hypothetical protein EV422DRAFT_572137 [Fimicolochytrium jonesii]